MNLRISMLLLSVAAIAACSDTRPAKDTAPEFSVPRRVVLYNVISGSYILSVEGLCDLTLNSESRNLKVRCKTGADEIKLHDLGLSDTVGYTVEQLNAISAVVYSYRIVYKPRMIEPALSKYSGEENVTDRKDPNH